MWEGTVERLEKENLKLRELLWLRHGCHGLYGDDGQMQCSKCFIDFKKDNIDIIYSRLLLGKLTY